MEKSSKMDMPIKKIKPPVLRVHEEKEILHHIVEKARRGEQVQRNEVIEKVVQFIKSDNRKNPFRNGTPGDKWFSLFRRRHNSQFLKLEKEQLKILERIGFTEKVMNTVTYKLNNVVKKPTVDLAWDRSTTPKRKRIPKVFKEYVSSMLSDSKLSTPSVSQDTSEVILTSPTSDDSCNINPDNSDKGQESHNDSTDFQPGAKLEVMDFNDDKWYPVKVVEVDYEDSEVLVHFEKWSNRYDEWVRMDSSRIRRPRLPSSNASKKVFVENERVIAVWAYNHKYPATVRKVLPSDKYEVLFCDGYAKILRGCKLFKATEEDLKNIQLPPPKKPAPPMGADPLDPDLGPKEERRLKKRRTDVYEALLPQKKHRDNSETPEIKTEPRSASPSPTRTPSTSKPKETFRVVLRGRGQARNESEESDGDDDGWAEDNDDSDQGPSPESKQKHKLKKKKTSREDSFHNRRSNHGAEEDPERWNMEIPEGAVPVQIKDTEGYYRESIIIPDKKLPAGWMKHTMRRKTGAKWDVFLVNENGRKFRSRNELRNYFAAELKTPFPEDSFDFMVGRKMEMIRSQTDGRRRPIESAGRSPASTAAIESAGRSPASTAAKSSPLHKKTDKKTEPKGESTPDQKRLKTLLPKGRNGDSGDDVKQETSPKSNSEATTSTPPFPIADVRTPDGGYSCCGKSFRKENLFQMHMKHYHPEYSNLFGSTPNVADLAYARTVGEPLEDSRAEAMTPRNSLLERVSRYEADRQRKSIEPVGETTPVTKVKSEKEASAVEKIEVEEGPKTTEIDIKEERISSEQMYKEKPSESEGKNEEERVLKEESKTQPEPVTEAFSPAPIEDKKTEVEDKVEHSTSSENVEDAVVGRCPPPSTVPPAPPSAPPSIPVIKPVIKSVNSKASGASEAVIVQTTSSSRNPVTITKYVPPGQSKSPDSKSLKVTISSDKEGKPTIKTLLPLRPPPAPVSASPTVAPAPPQPTVAAAEPQKPKEVKIKEESDDEAPSQTQKSKPRKRTVSEPLLKKPKLAKTATGSLEEETVEAGPSEPTPSTSTGSGSGYRFSRNRSQVPHVALEKLNVTHDSNGRVVVAPVEKKDKTHNTEGRRRFKKFKSANNISKKTKGTASGEDVAAKTQAVQETAAAAAADETDAYENLRKEEIINCTCGFTEEDGLMIQCDLCLCWQHGYCNNINLESEVPEKYVCYICLHPARQRESLRHLHNQDWLKEGKLPSFSFSRKDPEKSEQREKILKNCHELSASVVQLETVIHSLNVKTHIAIMKQDHPKLYLWAKSWKDRSCDVKNETEEDKNRKEGVGPQPEAAIDTTECRLRLLEHVEDYQTRVEDRLTAIDAQISALESEDPDLASDEMTELGLKQTVQMLLRDLTTLQQVATLNS